MTSSQFHQIHNLVYQFLEVKDTMCIILHSLLLRELINVLIINFQETHTETQVKVYFSWYLCLSGVKMSCIRAFTSHGAIVTDDGDNDDDYNDDNNVADADDDNDNNNNNSDDDNF